MKLNFNFESRKNHFLTSGISHPGWYLSPRFTVIIVVLLLCGGAEKKKKTKLNYKIRPKRKKSSTKSRLASLCIEFRSRHCRVVGKAQRCCKYVMFLVKTAYCTFFLTIQPS